MNLLAEIAPHIYYVGANDRKTHKFEALWPLPYGVSYNSYLIVDEKVALIDTIEASCTETYLDNIQKILNGRTIDYLVINHMEPDHSASIAAVKRAYPQIEIVGNAKTLDMVKGFYGITDNTITMKEGDSLCLGSKELVFYLIPMVHWPETMVSYCPQEKILFSGDAFGCFGALEGGIVDTQLDCEIYWDEMVRYYANIVGKYGAPVQKALSKLSGVPLEMICSTHGPVWKENIAKVIGIYDKLSRYEAEEGVVIAYGSMYGHTAQMAEEIAKELDMPVERVREILKISQEPVSLETPIGEEEDSHLGDFIQDDNVPVPAEAAAQTLLKEQLDEVLDTLTEREQKVLRLRFGMNDGRARTLEEVGKEFDVTRERIRQIEAKALRKLRHPSRSRKLRDYLD